MKFLNLRRLQHLRRCTAARKQRRRVRKNLSAKAVRKQREHRSMSAERASAMHMAMPDARIDFRQPGEPTDITFRGNAIITRSWEVHCAMEEPRPTESRRRSWDVPFGMEEPPHMEPPPQMAVHSTSNSRSTPWWMVEDKLPCGLMESQVGDLFDRDITPEDYEMLLQLDEMIAKPTASQESLESLTEVKTSDVAGECCTICLVSFDSDDSVTALRCGHPFHSSCVHKWLSEHSKRCPVCSHDA